jgi:hypothetical protein
MFIKLTNANKDFFGKPILLRKEVIVTVYNNIRVNEDSSIEEVTFVFAPPHGEWQVQESVEQIHEMLSGDQG